MLALVASVLLTVPAADAAPAGPAPAAATVLHPYVEGGLGLGLANDDVGLVPRLRGGVLLGIESVPSLRLGGDLALEGFITGEEGNGFATSSYWEALFVPRMLAGYELAVDQLLLMPIVFVAVAGGMRFIHTEFFGREDDRNELAFAGRLGLGFVAQVSVLRVGVEADVGLKDNGPAGTLAMSVGVIF